MRLRCIDTLCALVYLNLKFEPVCYRGRIPLMRKVMNYSFSYAKTEELWLQASIFVHSSQSKGECV